MITPIIALTAAIVGAVATYWLSTRRETRADLRKLRVELLLESYGAILDLDIGRRGSNTTTIKTASKVLERLMLLGEEDVVLLTRQVIQGFIDKGEADTTDLCILVREELRRELGLTPTQHIPLMNFTISPPNRRRQ